MITEGSAFDNGANFLYSDMSVARNTYERNIFYGTDKGGALKNNCGKLNMGINNIIHRTSTLEYAYGGCRKGDSENPQSFENYRNLLNPFKKTICLLLYCEMKDINAQHPNVFITM